jgi:hypothetical protein
MEAETMRRQKFFLLLLIGLYLSIVTGCFTNSGRNSANGGRSTRNKTASRLPARPAPDGFTAVNDDDGTGRALIGHFSGNARRASAAISGILQSLGGSYFDERPTATGGFCDQQDREAQASFTATLDDIPVRGVAAVVLAGDGGGSATLIFDQPEALPQSFPRLAQQLAASRPQPQPRAPVQMQRYQFPDGSGAVSLPDGWQLTSAAGGTVIAMGPQKEGIVLGGVQGVTTNPASAYPPALLAAPYSNPPRALADLLPQLSQGTRVERIIEAQAEPYGDGQSAYIHFTSANQLGRYEGLAYVIMRPAPGLNDTWIFNYSIVGAPADLFAQELPTLIDIWKSWQLSQSLVQSRIESAAQTMRSTNEILTQASQNRSEAYARANEAWDEVIRGQATIEDTSTGERARGDLNDADAIVNSDPARYRLVPLPELNR